MLLTLDELKNECIKLDKLEFDEIMKTHKDDESAQKSLLALATANKKI